MKKIGLIGCGAVAGYGHLPAIRAVPDLCLIAREATNQAIAARVKGE